MIAIGIVVFIFAVAMYIDYVNFNHIANMPCDTCKDD